MTCSEIRTRARRFWCASDLSRLPVWSQVALIVSIQLVIFGLDVWILPVQLQGVIIHAVPIMLAARLPDRGATIGLNVSAITLNAADDIWGDEGLWVVVTSVLLLAMIGFLSARWVAQERAERRRADENERLRSLLRAEHERLLDTQREQQMLLAMVSHDVAQPLSHVQVEAAILQGDPRLAEAESSRQALNGIARGLERLDLLVQDLFDLAQQRSEGLILRPEPIALTGPIRRVLESTGAPHWRRIAVNVPPDLPRVLADPRRVEQILANLLTNAAKYAPRHSLVRISVERAADALIVGVHDEGPGIPEAAREQIFEPFFRLPQGLARVPGQGLGLAMCRLLVEAHGGRIWAESEPTGGTVVRFTLPLAQARAVHQSA
jgi:signal transduction histidine kinase